MNIYLSSERIIFLIAIIYKLQIKKLFCWAIFLSDKLRKFCITLIRSIFLLDDTSNLWLTIYIYSILAMYTIVYLLLSTCLIPFCKACGVSTHISIAQEALHFFKKVSSMKLDYPTLIRENQDAFIAGAPYPDAMYSNLCFFGLLGDVAEDTHWVPFLKTSIEYVRKKYPQPWSKVRYLLKEIYLLGSEGIGRMVG